ncbi:YciE/YciF family protein [Deinococcus malanensis]|uniref:YciE/YciF family protein n=1 Tax=Deinococcus malanensis TaxID=1706855 RepID=A0ABQ2EKQ0_9DEIO|nr:ferritin-like domain-containing protein [Deinococcus malanensis]GGK14581.1 YciE/YciF family protein [Deinococcus malanensis]
MQMQMQDLTDLYVLKLQEIYSAEQQGLQAMQQGCDMVQTPELKEGLTMHIEQTQQQIQRLEQLFQKMGAQPGGETNLAMQGLVQEVQKLMQQPASPEVLEAGLIACQQAMEHYEIAGYGTARTYAQLLGDDEAVQMLEQTLNEEKMTDEQLTMIAQRINVEAMNA